MAVLKGLIKIIGSLDGLTFYKGKNGYFIRTKGGISKSRIKTTRHLNEPGRIPTNLAWLRLQEKYYGIH
ncbi:hypothetical protein [Leeuwenhoekiella sp. ZYFB001]|uniref:hypothetical protein n=1 Tax=Leeuwenhoekiella sp. ZYFB001 TaxID=2719912 RepID=UPI001F0E0B21|nr:hypothetical protein [Leeuwenhoekiella sp. ZYFB001]